MSDQYAAIAAERGRFPVRMMCAALGVSRRVLRRAVAGAPRARGAGRAAPRRGARDVHEVPQALRGAACASRVAGGWHARG